MSFDYPKRNAFFELIPLKMGSKRAKANKHSLFIEGKPEVYLSNLIWSISPFPEG